MPLQKSHSDLNYRSRGPGYRQPNWSRSKSNSNVQYGPKVAVSGVTKNKLQQFTFDRADVLEDTADSSTKPDDDAVNGDQKENIPDGNTPNPAKTPHNRPSWTDLLAVFEKSSEKKDQEPRPAADTIGWGPSIPKIFNKGGPSGSPACSRKNNQKRARSSSPTSSPPIVASQTPSRASINQLAQAARSPYADPTTELWDRYALGNKRNNGPGANANSPAAGGPLSNPLLVQVMVSSSPRPHKSGESGFKRAIGCGTNRQKRRRIDRTMEGGTLVIGDNGIDSPSAKRAKTSMVAEILETVNVEILNTANHHRATPSFDLPSSPSPKKTRESSQICTYRSSMDAPGRPISLPEQQQTNGNQNGVGSSSDYGDDDFDFDEDTLMELDSTQVATHHNNIDVGLEALQPTAEQPMNAAAKPPPAPLVAQWQEATAPVPVEEDEFDDMDDDVFEELAASLPDKPISPKRRQQQTPQRRQVGDASSTAMIMDMTTADDDYGDDFGDDFDFNAVELAATQAAAASGIVATTSQTGSEAKSRIIQRYLVTKVVEGYYPNARGHDAPEVILLVEVEKTKEMRTIYLREDWIDTPVNVKAYVHVIGTFNHDRCIVIDNSQHILILHPDQLISSTVVADSFSCTRRAVLQDRVKAASEPTAPLVYGTMLHEIFQEALIAKDWSRSFLGSCIRRIAQKHVQDLYTIKVNLEEAESHLMSKMGELQSWASTFVAPHPKPHAIVNGRNGDKATMAVTKLLDVEEHVWSPMYGLKGNIDATIEVKMQEGKTQRTLVVPFEVKTGKSENTSHQTQTVLYNLLLSDRYDIEIAYGVLYYMETSKTTRIPAIRHELRHMILQRNRLACYLRDRNVQLPEMKRSQRMCGHCYAKTSCFIYHKLADDGTAETSAVGEKFDEVVSHLTSVHKEFFLKWEDLLTKEEKETQKLKRELWTMLGPEREKLGRCLAGVVIEEGSENEEKAAATATEKINRFRYTFIKDPNDSKVDPSKISFLDSQLGVGEPIVVSSEEGHFALGLGFVTAVRKTRISVAVDRRLHNSRTKQPGFDEETNQVFAGIMEVVPRPKSSTPPAETTKPVVRFRLDKDEFNNGMATVRNNLIQTMTNSPSGQHVRRLVVDLDLPKFKDVATQYTISSGYDSLNEDQKNAVEKVMSAQDYALVLGMPGTGKTTTIAHIIRALVAQGKSVLLTSYTHTAVDNILLKLKTDKLPILRLGAPAKVHPEVQNFATLAGQGMDSFEAIHEAWHETPIVATTCLGTSHPLFHERKFDYCIVDEASQITLPICIGPIRMARRFVLVGDHYQLPPLVQNEEARRGGLDVSLFKLLSDSHPEGVVNLEHQYRMCEDIMTLSNTLIYDGRLKCGTEELGRRKLDLVKGKMEKGLRGHHYGTSLHRVPPPSNALSTCTGPTNLGGCWLRNLLDPEARVRFVNTDTLGQAARETSSKGKRIVNASEVSIVTSLVVSLLSSGVPAEEIGVMTHYRSQLSLLKHSLSRHLGGAGPAAGVEMHTADRFQGRDKEVVVLSLVRSNDAGSIGELLRDWRRINVAFTRAKTKLLVVGSRDTLRGNGNGNGNDGKGKKKPLPDGNKDGDGDEGKGEEEEEEEEEMVSKFVQLMEDKRWIYDLPESALEDHLFEEEQATPLSGSSNCSPRRPRPVPAAATATTTTTTAAAAAARAASATASMSQLTVTNSPHSSTSTSAAAAARAAKPKRPKKGTLMINQEIDMDKENKDTTAAARGRERERHLQPRKQGKISERHMDSVLKGKPILRNVLDEFLG
ncbi:hypothetical protein MKZ38_009595 [Zalerion maritima]|uniref:DNA replication ATP-dependent helicase/nuclease n=1 Tax=Zalerion maritima TaxID=339359 RepID=A0AAD5WN31_9PEZI|nr:hypothetical protein MKZ38_009595 [Zalerion maritima]